MRKRLSLRGDVGLSGVKSCITRAFITSPEKMEEKTIAGETKHLMILPAGLEANLGFIPIWS